MLDAYPLIGTERPGPWLERQHTLPIGPSATRKIGERANGLEQDGING